MKITDLIQVLQGAEAAFPGAEVRVSDWDDSGGLIPVWAADVNVGFVDLQADEYRPVMQLRMTRDEIAAAYTRITDDG